MQIFVGVIFRIPDFFKFCFQIFVLVFFLSFFWSLLRSFFSSSSLPSPISPHLSIVSSPIYSLVSVTSNADALAFQHVQLWLALFRAELACGSELARRRNAAQVSISPPPQPRYRTHSKTDHLDHSVVSYLSRSYLFSIVLIFVLSILSPF